MTQQTQKVESVVHDGLRAGIQAAGLTASTSMEAPVGRSVGRPRVSPSSLSLEPPLLCRIMFRASTVVRLCSGRASEPPRAVRPRNGARKASRLTTRAETTRLRWSSIARRYAIPYDATAARLNVNVALFRHAGPARLHVSNSAWDQHVPAAADSSLRCSTRDHVCSGNSA